MKAKLNDILMAAVFVVFLFGFLMAALLTPDQSFSEYERRRLAEFPNPSWKSVQSTVWMDNFETYTLDSSRFARRFAARNPYLNFMDLPSLTWRGCIFETDICPNRNIR